MSNLEKAVKIAKELERRKATNIMADYKPYEYQKKFPWTNRDIELYFRVIEQKLLKTDSLK